MRRADLQGILKRYRRLMRRKALRRQSRLEWRRAGAVWAADFKERREPLEGRYGWILSIKDLGSGCQLAWQPLVHATAGCVQEIYAQLFAQHGPPLVLKSDNGGQFKADDTKALLAEHCVLPLYSPKRRPQYNGGVERANGQLAGYQEAIAAHRQRPAGPTCDDAEAARQLANDLSYPRGWQGPTAGTLFAQRTPLTPDERAAFGGVRSAEGSFFLGVRPGKLGSSRKEVADGDQVPPAWQQSQRQQSPWRAARCGQAAVLG